MSWLITHLTNTEQTESVKILVRMKDAEPDEQSDGKAAIEKLLSVAAARASKRPIAAKQEFYAKWIRREKIHAQHRALSKREIDELHELNDWFQRACFNPETEKPELPR